MKTFSKQLKQAGISLLEVLLSLAIIAIILVMAMQYFSTASNNQKLNMVRTFIGADMAAIQGYGINNNGFTNLSWSELVQKGYLSVDTKSLACTGSGSTASCQQKTPWGDNVDIKGMSGSYITLDFALPTNMCTVLLESYGPTVVTCGTDGKATVVVSGTAPASGS